MLPKKVKKLSWGFIDLVSLITLGFLVISLLVGSSVISKKGFSFDIRKLALDYDYVINKGLGKSYGGGTPTKTQQDGGNPASAPYKQPGMGDLKLYEGTGKTPTPATPTPKPVGMGDLHLFEATGQTPTPATPFPTPKQVGTGDLKLLEQQQEEEKKKQEEQAAVAEAAKKAEEEAKLQEQAAAEAAKAKRAEQQRLDSLQAAKEQEARQEQAKIDAQKLIAQQAETARQAEINRLAQESQKSQEPAAKENKLPGVGAGAGIDVWKIANNIFEGIRCFFGACKETKQEKQIQESTPTKLTAADYREAARWQFYTVQALETDLKNAEAAGNSNQKNEITQKLAEARIELNNLKSESEKRQTEENTAKAKQTGRTQQEKETQGNREALTKSECGADLVCLAKKVASQLTEQKSGDTEQPETPPESPPNEVKLSSLKGGSKGCSNGGKAGSIVTWGGHLKGCNSNTGDWVDLSAAGYTPEDVVNLPETDFPDWLNPGSKTWKALTEAATTVPAEQNPDGTTKGTQKTAGKWCNLGYSGAPPGTVSAGGVGTRSKCDGGSGKWVACSNTDPNNYCALTIIPSYVSEAQLKDETQKMGETINNMLSIYQNHLSGCQKGAEECKAEAKAAAKITNDALITRMEEQNTAWEKANQNFYPAYEKYLNCLSSKSEKECVGEKALVNQVYAQTGLDASILGYAKDRYARYSYEKIIQESFQLQEQFDKNGCGSSDSQNCRNIKDKLAQIKLDPVFRYFDLKGALANCSISACSYLQSQLTELLKDPNVKNIDISINNLIVLGEKIDFKRPESYYTDYLKANEMLRRAVAAINSGSDRTLAEICREGGRSSNACSGKKLDEYREWVLSQLDPDFRKMIEGNYLANAGLEEETLNEQMRVQPYSPCGRTVSYGSWQGSGRSVNIGQSCSGGGSCVGGFCVNSRSETVELSEELKEQIQNEIIKNQADCGSKMSGSTYNRAIGACVRMTDSGIPEITSLGRKVESKADCATTETYSGGRCYIGTKAAVDLVVGTRGNCASGYRNSTNIFSSTCVPLLKSDGGKDDLGSNVNRFFTRLTADYMAVNTTHGTLGNMVESIINWGWGISADRCSDSKTKECSQAEKTSQHSHLEIVNGELKEVTEKFSIGKYKTQQEDTVDRAKNNALVVSLYDLASSVDGLHPQEYLNENWQVDINKLKQNGYYTQVEKHAQILLDAQVKYAARPGILSIFNYGYVNYNDVASLSFDFQKRYAEENKLTFRPVINFNPRYVVDDNNKVTLAAEGSTVTRGEAIYNSLLNFSVVGVINSFRDVGGKSSSPNSFAHWFYKTITATSNAKNLEYRQNLVIGDGPNSVNSSLKLVGRQFNLLIDNYSEWSQKPGNGDYFTAASQAANEYSEKAKDNIGYIFAPLARNAASFASGFVSNVFRLNLPVSVVVQVGTDVVSLALEDALTYSSRERFVDKIKEGVKSGQYTQNEAVAVSAALQEVKNNEYLTNFITSLAFNFAGETFGKYVADKSLRNALLKNASYAISSSRGAVVDSVEKISTDLAGMTIIGKKATGELLEFTTREQAERTASEFIEWAVVSQESREAAQEVVENALKTASNPYLAISPKKATQGVLDALEDNSAIEAFSSLRQTQGFLSSVEKSPGQQFIDRLVNRLKPQNQAEVTLSQLATLSKNGEIIINSQSIIHAADGETYDLAKLFAEGKNVRIVIPTTDEAGKTIYTIVAAARKAEEFGDVVLKPGFMIQISDNAFTKGVNETLGEETLKAFNLAKSVDVPNYVRYTNGELVRTFKSLDEVTFSPGKKGMFVEVVEAGKVRKAIINSEGQIVKLDPFASFISKNAQGLAKGIDSSTGSFSFGKWFQEAFAPVPVKTPPANYLAEFSQHVDGIQKGALKTEDIKGVLDDVKTKGTFSYKTPINEQINIEFDPNAKNFDEITQKIKGQQQIRFEGVDGGVRIFVSEGAGSQAYRERIIPEIIVDNGAQQRITTINPIFADNQTPFRLAIPKNATDGLKKEITDLNDLIDNFESSFGYHIRRDQLEILAAPESIRQLTAGGGKTEVVSHLLAGMERRSVFTMQNITDAEDFAQNVFKRKDYYERAGIVTVYYDNEKGFLEIAEDFKAIKAKAIDPDIARSYIDAAAANPQKQGLMVITVGGDNAWGLIKGRAQIGDSSADMLYKMLLRTSAGGEGYTLVIDEIGAVINGRYSVAFGQPVNLLNLDKANLLGLSSGDELVKISGEVTNASTVQEFKDQVVAKIRDIRLQDCLKTPGCDSSKITEDLFFIYRSGKGGNIKNVLAIPRDESLVKRSYAEIIDQAVTKSNLPQGSQLRVELEQLSIKLKNQATIGSSDELQKEFVNLLRRSAINFDGATEENFKLLADLTYRKNLLEANWYILSKVPENDFGEELGELVLRRTGGTTGEEFSEIVNKVALRTQGPDLLEAAGYKIDKSELIPLEELTVTPRSSQITNLEIYQDVVDKYIGYDATPDTAANILGVKATAASEHPPAPNIIITGMRQDKIISEGIEAQKLAGRLKGKTHVIVNVDNGVSFGVSTDALVKNYDSVQVVARTKYKTYSNGAVNTEYFFEKVTRLTDGTVETVPIREITTLDDWQKAIVGYLGEGNSPDSLLIIYEGRARAVDFKPTIYHKDFRWTIIANDTNDMEEITQAVKRNRVFAQQKALLEQGSWTADQIKEATEFDLWVRTDNVNLTKVNVIDHFEEVLRNNIARNNVETAFSRIVRTQTDVFEDVKENLLSKTVNSQKRQKIIKELDTLIADAQRIEQLQARELARKPLTGETLAEEMWLRGKGSFDRINVSLESLAKNYNISSKELQLIKIKFGLEGDFIGHDEFISLWKSTDKEVTVFQPKGPKQEVLYFAQSSTPQNLKDVAIFQSASNPPTETKIAAKVQKVTATKPFAAIKNFGNGVILLRKSAQTFLANQFNNLKKAFVPKTETPFKGAGKEVVKPLPKVIKQPEPVKPVVKETKQKPTVTSKIIKSVEDSSKKIAPLDISDQITRLEQSIDNTQNELADLQKKKADEQKSIKLLQKSSRSAQEITALEIALQRANVVYSQAKKNTQDVKNKIDIVQNRLQELNRQKEELNKLQAQIPETNVAKDINTLIAFSQKTELESRDNYEQSLNNATKVLENPKRTGIFELPKGIPTIVVSDLHARRDFVLETMQMKVKELGSTPVYELLKQGKINIVFVGDGMHSDIRENWQANNDSEKQRKLTQEMVRSLGTMKMIMDLMVEFPNNLVYLRGNHDEIYGSFRKYAHESSDVRNWIFNKYGRDFLDKWARFENLLPLLARGQYLIASHTAPDYGYTADDIALRTDDAVHGLRWTDNEKMSESDLVNPFKITLRNLGLPNAVWIIGHRPVRDALFRSQLNGRLIQINSSQKHVVVYVPASGQFSPSNVKDLKGSVAPIRISVSKPGLSQQEIIRQQKIVDAQILDYKNRDIHWNEEYRKLDLQIEAAKKNLDNVQTDYDKLIHATSELEKIQKNIELYANREPTLTQNLKALEYRKKALAEWKAIRENLAGTGINEEIPADVIKAIRSELETSLSSFEKATTIILKDIESLETRIEELETKKTSEEEQTLVQTEVESPVRDLMKEEKKVFESLYKDNSQPEVLRILLGKSELQPVKVIEIDGYKFYMGDAILAAGHDQAIMYVEFRKDGKKVIIPRILYLSNSDGGWRSSPGYNDERGIYSKGIGAHYTQETKPHSLIVNYLNSLTKTVESADLLEIDFKISELKKIGWYTYPEEISIERKNLEEFQKYPPGYYSKLAASREIFSNFKYPKGFIPDFSQIPIRVEKSKHTILGEITLETYRGTLNGRKVNWVMAYGEKGRVWVERIYFAEAKVNSYGVYSEVIDSGALTNKPIEYKSQTSKLQEEKDFVASSWGIYVDITPLLDSLLPIMEFRKAKGIVRSTERKVVVYSSEILGGPQKLGGIENSYLKIYRDKDNNVVAIENLGDANSIIIKYGRKESFLNGIIVLQDETVEIAFKTIKKIWKNLSGGKDEIVDTPTVASLNKLNYQGKMELIYKSAPGKLQVFKGQQKTILDKPLEISNKEVYGIAVVDGGYKKEIQENLQPKAKQEESISVQPQLQPQPEEIPSSEEITNIELMKDVENKLSKYSQRAEVVKVVALAIKNNPSITDKEEMKRQAIAVISDEYRPDPAVEPAFAKLSPPEKVNLVTSILGASVINGISVINRIDEQISLQLKTPTQDEIPPQSQELQPQTEEGEAAEAEEPSAQDPGWVRTLFAVRDRLSQTVSRLPANFKKVFPRLKQEIDFRSSEFERHEADVSAGLEESTGRNLPDPSPAWENLKGKAPKALAWAMKAIDWLYKPEVNTRFSWVNRLLTSLGKGVGYVFNVTPFSIGNPEKVSWWRSLADTGVYIVTRALLGPIISTIFKIYDGIKAIRFGIMYPTEIFSVTIQITAIFVFPWLFQASPIAEILNKYFGMNLYGEPDLKLINILIRPISTLINTIKANVWAFAYAYIISRWALPQWLLSWLILPVQVIVILVQLGLGIPVKSNWQGYYGNYNKVTPAQVITLDKDHPFLKTAGEIIGQGVKNRLLAVWNAKPNGQFDLWAATRVVPVVIGVNKFSQLPLISRIISTGTGATLAVRDFVQGLLKPAVSWIGRQFGVDTSVRILPEPRVGKLATGPLKFIDDWQHPKKIFAKIASYITNVSPFSWGNIYKTGFLRSLADGAIYTLTRILPALVVLGVIGPVAPLITGLSILAGPLFLYDFLRIARFAEIYPWQAAEIGVRIGFIALFLRGTGLAKVFFPPAATATGPSAAQSALEYFVNLVKPLTDLVSKIQNFTSKFYVVLKMAVLYLIGDIVFKRWVPAWLISWPTLILSTVVHLVTGIDIANYKNNWIGYYGNYRKTAMVQDFITKDVPMVEEDPTTLAIFLAGEKVAEIRKVNGSADFIKAFGRKNVTIDGQAIPDRKEIRLSEGNTIRIGKGTDMRIFKVEKDILSEKLIIRPIPATVEYEIKQQQPQRKYSSVVVELQEKYQFDKQNFGELARLIKVIKDKKVADNEIYDEVVKELINNFKDEKGIFQKLDLDTRKVLVEAAIGADISRQISSFLSAQKLQEKPSEAVTEEKAKEPETPEKQPEPEVQEVTPEVAIASERARKILDNIKANLRYRNILNIVPPLNFLWTGKVINQSISLLTAPKEEIPVQKLPAEKPIEPVVKKQTVVSQKRQKLLDEYKKFVADNQKILKKYKISPKSEKQLAGLTDEEIQLEIPKLQGIIESLKKQEEENTFADISQQILDRVKNQQLVLKIRENLKYRSLLNILPPADLLWTFKVLNGEVPTTVLEIPQEQPKVVEKVQPQRPKQIQQQPRFNEQNIKQQYGKVIDEFESARSEVNSILRFVNNYEFVKLIRETRDLLGEKIPDIDALIRKINQIGRLEDNYSNLRQKIINTAERGAELAGELDMNPDWNYVNNEVKKSILESFEQNGYDGEKLLEYLESKLIDANTRRIGLAISIGHRKGPIQGEIDIDFIDNALLAEIKVINQKILEELDIWAKKIKEIQETNEPQPENKIEKQAKEIIDDINNEDCGQTYLLVKPALAQSGNSGSGCSASQKIAQKIIRATKADKWGWMNYAGIISRAWGKYQPLDKLRQDWNLSFSEWTNLINRLQTILEGKMPMVVLSDILPQEEELSQIDRKISKAWLNGNLVETEKERDREGRKLLEQIGLNLNLTSPEDLSFILPRMFDAGHARVLEPLTFSKKLKNQKQLPDLSEYAKPQQVLGSWLYKYLVADGYKVVARVDAAKLFNANSVPTAISNLNGDYLLRVIVGTIQKALGANFVILRSSGDEYVIMGSKDVQTTLGEVQDTIKNQLKNIKMSYNLDDRVQLLPVEVNFPETTPIEQIFGTLTKHISPVGLVNDIKYDPLLTNERQKVFRDKEAFIESLTGAKYLIKIDVPGVLKWLNDKQGKKAGNDFIKGLFDEVIKIIEAKLKSGNISVYKRGGELYFALPGNLTEAEVTAITYSIKGASVSLSQKYSLPVIIGASAEFIDNSSIEAINQALGKLSPKVFQDQMEGIARLLSGESLGEAAWNFFFEYFNPYDKRGLLRLASLGLTPAKIKTIKGYYKQVEEKWKIADPEKMQKALKAALEKYLPKDFRSTSVEKMKLTVSEEIISLLMAKFSKDETFKANYKIFTDRKEEMRQVVIDFFKRTVNMARGGIIYSNSQQLFNSIEDELKNKAVYLEDDEKKDLQKQVELIWNIGKSIRNMVSFGIDIKARYSTALSKFKNWVVASKFQFNVLRGSNQTLDWIVTVLEGDLESFDAKKELKKLTKTKPLTQERKEAVEKFKTAYAFQLKGLAELRVALEDEIRNNPSISKKQIMKIFSSYRKEYRLTASHRKIVLDIFKAYQQNQRNMRELRKKYPDKRELFKALFGKYPEGEITVIYQPVSILFILPNDDDYTYVHAGRLDGRLVSDVSDRERAKLSAGVEGVGIKLEKPYLVAAVRDPSQWAIDHEERHSINELLESYFDLKPTNGPNILLGNKIADEKVLAYYLSEIDRRVFDKTKDELIAYITITSAGEEFLTKELSSILNEKESENGLYDYYESVKNNGYWLSLVLSELTIDEREIIEEKIKKLIGTVERYEYRKKIIDNAIKAFLDLQRRGFNKREILAFFEVEPIIRWPRVVTRLEPIIKEKYEQRKGIFINVMGKIDWSEEGTTILTKGDFDQYFIKKGIYFYEADLENFLNDLKDGEDNLTDTEWLNYRKLMVILDFYKGLDDWDNENVSEFLERDATIRKLIEEVTIDQRKKASFGEENIRIIDILEGRSKIIWIREPHFVLQSRTTKGEGRECLYEYGPVV